MKKNILFLQILSFISITSCSVSSNNIVYPSQNLIIRFNDHVNQEQINKLNQKNGIKSFELISKELNIIDIKTDTKNIEQIKSIYQNNKLVKYVTPDAKLSLFPFKASAVDSNFKIKDLSFEPNDPLYQSQWNATAIEANKAWAITTGSSNVTVAVIDSGVDPNHPDLKNNLLPLIDIWNESGQDDIYKTTTGLSIDYIGRDGNGHGTHVSGIIGAMINNSIGIAGISSSVKILPIKSANYAGDTYASVITKAIIRAIDEGAKVINISIGGPKADGTKALQDAVELAISKGIVISCAVGNESDRSKGIITEVTVPAAYSGVLAVGATTEFGKVANYSNGGSEVSLTAPGGFGAIGEGRKIYSTWPTYKTYFGYTENIVGPYAAISGTSMSSPHVAGVAALIFSKEPNLSAQKVRVRILSTTISPPITGFDQANGYGQLNAYNALIKNTDDKN